MWTYLQSLIRSFLQSWGLLGKEGTLLVLGLDNAGKTTLLHRLKTGGEIRSFPPTDRPTLEDFTLPGTALHFTAWDLGGHEAVRHLWEDYVSTQVSAVLFLIDATDSDRLEEAAFELDALVGEQLLAGLPVAILLNKCDIPEACSTDEICQRIEFTRLQYEHAQQCTNNGTNTDNPSERSAAGKQMSVNHLVNGHYGVSWMNVYRISVLQGQGYAEALQWVGKFL